MQTRFVDLTDAAPDETVVVVDVLRAFTTVPWLLHRGAERVLAVASRDGARRLRDEHLPDALLAGEHGGRKVADFDLGNSPSELSRRDLTGRTVILRTSAGTRGLVRCTGSRLLLAASFVVAEATAQALVAADARRVTYVVTGASLGRDGDEDLACAELIAARVAGEHPDGADYVRRVARSDAGRSFAPDGSDWAPPQDLALACELDRFATALRVRPSPDVGALEITATRPGRAGPYDRPSSKPSPSWAPAPPRSRR